MQSIESKKDYKIILVNSNPATIMTDPNVADITYIEPINDRVSGGNNYHKRKT